MIRPQIRGARKNQEGFTLLELLVALAILGIILVGVAATYFQTFGITAAGNNHIQAINNAQNAGVWIVRDGQQAQTIISDDPATTSVTEVLTLKWDFSAYIPGDVHTIRYAISNQNLTRSDNGGTAIVIAGGIKTGSDFNYTKITEADGSFYYRLTVKSTIGIFEQRDTTLTFYFKSRLT